jgi:hypothetical protein
MDIQTNRDEIFMGLGNDENQPFVPAIEKILSSSTKSNPVFDNLDASLERGLAQAEAGQVRSHKDVMDELWNRYSDKKLRIK